MVNEKHFDFDSGDLCLDFANTSDWHASQHPEEKLADYQDLIVWARQAGLVTERKRKELEKLAQRRPEKAALAFNKAILLREAIYRIFSSLHASEECPPEDIAILNNALGDALPHLVITANKGGFEWQWDENEVDFSQIYWPVARAAAELLTSDQLERLRECEDDRGCGYLFIDQSKNRSRRWCSMESCGNRAKARRHYARQQDLKVDEI